jgi:ABC-type amino acid transport substrate-binding protein
MKRRIILFLSLWALFSGLTPLTPAAAGIRVGVYQLEPLIFIDDNLKPKGIWIDILERIAHSENWQLEYVPGSFPECLTRLKTGEIDLLLSVAYSKNRAEAVTFSREPLLYNYLEVFVPPGSKIKSIVDLNEKKVAVFKGSYSQTLFAELADGYGITPLVLETMSYSDVFKAVENKSADAGIVNHFFAMVNSYHYHVEKTNILFGSFQSHFATPKTGRPELLDAIDRHLVELKADKNSFHYRTVDKWLGGFSGEKKIPRWIEITLVSLAGVAALFMIFFGVMRFQVKAKTAELAGINALKCLATAAMNSLVWGFPMFWPSRIDTG